MPGGGKTEWIDFADDGEMLWAYADGAIVEIATASLEVIRRIAVKSPFPRLLAVSPDARLIATGRYQRQVQVIDRRTGEPVAPQMDHQPRARVDRAMFAKDGSRLMTISREQVRVWDTATGTLLAPPYIHDVRVNDAALAPSGTSVAISTYPRRDGWAGQPSTVQVWSLSPDPRPAETLRLLSEVSSASHIDDAGGRLPLSPNELRARWDTFASELTIPSEGARRNLWHRQQADGGDRFGQKFHQRKVVDALDERLAAAPADIGLRRERVGWLKRIGDPTAVIAAFSELIHLEPAEASHWQERASQLISAGRPEEALSDLSEAIRLRPGNTWLLRERAQLYNRLSHPKAALGDVMTIVELHEGDSPDAATANDVRLNYQAACLALLVEDAAAYREACQRAIRFAHRLAHPPHSVERWNATFHAVWTCALSSRCELGPPAWQVLLDLLDTAQLEETRTQAQLLGRAIGRAR